MVNNGRMVMQTDLDLHGHRLMNNNQGGVSFDSGGVISLHDNLNTNGYSIVGKNGGGFEIRDDGSIRRHGTFDLNGYRIDGVLSFAAGEIFFAKNINMNGHVIKHSSNLKYSINGTFDRARQQCGKKQIIIRNLRYTNLLCFLNSQYYKRLRVGHSRDRYK